MMIVLDWVMLSGTLHIRHTASELCPKNFSCGWGGWSGKSGRLYFFWPKRFIGQTSILLNNWMNYRFKLDKTSHFTLMSSLYDQLSWRFINIGRHDAPMPPYRHIHVQHTGCSPCLHTQPSVMYSCTIKSCFLSNSWQFWSTKGSKSFQHDNHFSVAVVNFRWQKK